MYQWSVLSLFDNGLQIELGVGRTFTYLAYKGLYNNNGTLKLNIHFDVLPEDS